MKKLLAIVLALMLAVSCSAVAFADTATTDTASPDEAVTVTSLEFTKLPDKLVYTDEDVDWEIDFDSIESWEDLDEAVYSAPMTLYFKLDGGELLATYSNGETAVVMLEECNVKLADSLTYGEMLDLIFEAEEEDFITAVYRDYTVNVEYEGAATTYTITLEESEYDYNDESDYEVISFTNPEKLEYTKDDIEVETWYDYDFDTDEEIEVTENYIYPDTTGMTAVVRNKESGAIFTVEDISADGVVVEDIDKVNQTFTVDACAFIYDDEYNLEFADFQFDIYYNVVDLNPNNNTKADDNNKEEKSASTPDTADNKAIQTGDAFPAVLMIVIATGALAVAYFYRRKFSL